MGDVLEGNATPSQLAAFIFGLRCKGETLEEMTGLVRAMLDAAVPVEFPPEVADRVIDTCGTGGDRQECRSKGDSSADDGDDAHGASRDCAHG